MALTFLCNLQLGLPLCLQPPSAPSINPLPPPNGQTMMHPLSATLPTLMSEEKALSTDLSRSRSASCPTLHNGA